MKLIKRAGCGSGTCPTIFEVAAGCANDGCPTVWTDDTGRLVIQGAVVDPADVGIDVPDGEQLVEIPAALLQEYIDRQARMEDDS
jgi:hypothetical protein